MAKKEKQVLGEDETNTPETITETPASDTIDTHSTDVSRSEVMSQAMQHIASMPDTHLTKWWADALDSMTHLADSIPGDAAERNKASISAKPSGANPVQPGMAAIQTVKEDLASILKEQKDLPPEFVDKALVLFEAAINTRVQVEAVKIQEAADAQIEEQVEALVEKIDEYLEYAAEEFFEENKLAVESSVRLDLYEDFIEGLHDLFSRHYIEMPEERTDVVDALGSRVDELEDVLNDRTAEVLALKDALDAERASRVFDNSAEGLTPADVEKFRKVSETVEFSGDEEELAKQLKIIREAHFSKEPAKTGRKLEMVAEGDGNVVEVQPTRTDDNKNTILENVSPEVAPFVAAISRIGARR